MYIEKKEGMDSVRWSGWVGGWVSERFLFSLLLLIACFSLLLWVSPSRPPTHPPTLQHPTSPSPVLLPLVPTTPLLSRLLLSLLLPLLLLLLPLQAASAHTNPAQSGWVGGWVGGLDEVLESMGGLGCIGWVGGWVGTYHYSFSETVLYPLAALGAEWAGGWLAVWRGEPIPHAGG